MKKEKRLVLARAFRITDEQLIAAGDCMAPIAGTNYYNLDSGFFAGDPSSPSEGTYIPDVRKLYDIVRDCSRQCDELSTRVDMNYEGVASDEGLTLVLQPIHKVQSNDGRLAELMKQYGMQ